MKILATIALLALLAGCDTGPKLPHSRHMTPIVSATGDTIGWRDEAACERIARLRAASERSAAYADSVTGLK